MEVNCILCVDKTNGIGKNNQLPWHFTEDMKQFKSITSHNYFENKKNAIIMGRNTYESIGRKELPNRYNYILSSQISNNYYNNIQNAFLNMKTFGINKAFIIGGKLLFEHFINNKLVKNIYLTKIDGNFDCDTHVKLNLDNYKKVTCVKENLQNQKDGLNYNILFEKYENMNYVCQERWIYKNNNYYCNFDEMNYLNIMESIIEKGHFRKTRNSNTFGTFGQHLKFTLKDNTIPLLTTKKMFIRGVIEELIFFLKGQTDSKLLEEKGVNIWKPNTTETFLKQNKLNYREGDIGPMYGFQWRYFNADYLGCDSDYSGKGIDQLNEVIEDLKKDRYSRRILMTTYNPCQAKLGVLYPCHGLVVQFGIEGNNELSCHMYQRSADYALGVPFNIASYAILVYILCSHLNCCGYDFIPGNLYMSFGDVHLYESHVSNAKLQIENTPYLFPKIHINAINDIEDIKVSDIKITDYECHEKIIYDMYA